VRFSKRNIFDKVAIVPVSTFVGVIFAAYVKLV
jgi:hypothetical protein